MNPFELPGRWLVTTALFLLVLPRPVLPAAGDALTAGLEACAAVTDAAERLNCFDVLAERIAERDPAASGQALPPLVDEVGKPATNDEAPDEEYAGRIASCEKSDASGRWYFTFDNGQIWRQTNAGRLPFRECDFDVTLKRDVFGYKLEIPSADRSVRVTRVH